ncbi:MAG: thermonuclease family protein [Burkholderiales bacterium]|nr:thermonuclease family protein [Burkholderiales bacterium]
MGPLSAAAFALAALAAAELAGRVIAVESGDTLTLDAGGRTVTVRLADISAPQGPAFFAPGARTLLANMTLDQGARVVVAGDPGAARVVGHVYVGELDVNLALVKRGAAWMCMEYTSSTYYLPFQNAAMRQRIGVWSQMTSFDTRVACRDRPPVAGASPAATR